MTAADSASSSALPPTTRTLPVHLRRVLVLDAGPIAPMETAGDRAIADLLDSLVAIGAKVHFHGLGSRGPDDLELLRAIRGRSPMITATSENPSIDDLLAGGDFDVVIASRPGTALAVSAALRRHPELLRIYWGHDIHSMRLSAQNALLGVPEDHRTRITALAERTNWSTFDCSVYPAQFEADHVHSILGDDRAVAFPYYRLTDLDLPQQVPPHAGRRGLLMVGLGAHAPNADAAVWMVDEILPLIESASASLTIVGRWEPELRERLAHPAVTFTGLVSDDELRALHLQHLCLIAPLRFGGGTRRKLVGSMGFGLPVVTTPEGLRGLLVRDGIDGSDGISVGGDPTELATAVHQLMDDASWWSSLSHAAQRAAGWTYGSDAYDRSLIDLLMRSDDRRTALR